MSYLISLPIIFIAVAIILVGKFTKFKLLMKLFKLVLFLAIAFLVYGYIKEYGFSLEGLL